MYILDSFRRFLHVPPAMKKSPVRLLMAVAVALAGSAAMALVGVQEWRKHIERRDWYLGCHDFQSVYPTMAVKRICKPPLARLLARPEDYDGERVQVNGILVWGATTVTFYESLASSQNFSEGIRIVGPDADALAASSRQTMYAPMTLKGVYRARHPVLESYPFVAGVIEPDWPLRIGKESWNAPRPYEGSLEALYSILEPRGAPVGEAP